MKAGQKVGQKWGQIRLFKKIMEDPRLNKVGSDPNYSRPRFPRRLDTWSCIARLSGKFTSCIRPRRRALLVKALGTILGFLVLSATTTVAAAAAGDCKPDQWLADPGISPAVLEANGYRVVTRRTLTLDDGGQAVETAFANGPREARCRVHYDANGFVVETRCYLPCRDPDP